MKDCFVRSAWIRFLCAVLCLFVLLPVCAGCAGSTPDPKTETQSESDTLPVQGGTDTETEQKGGDETEPEPSGMVLDGTFRLYCAPGAESAAKAVGDAVKELFGVSLKVESSSCSDKSPDGGHRILIGDTADSASASAMATLREKDYLYSVPEEGVVVLAGWNADSLRSAAGDFLSDQYGYTGPGTGHAAGIEVGAGKTVRQGSYPISELTFNGMGAGGMTVFYLDNEGKTAGKEITDRVTSLTGYMPRLVQGKAGSYDLPGIYLLGGSGELFYSIGRSGQSVLIEAPSGGLKEAVGAFLSEYLDLSDSGEEKVGIETSDLTRLTYLSGTLYDNRLRLVGRQDTEVRDGITYIELNYTNKKEKPVLVKAIVAKKGSADVLIGSPNAQDYINVLQTPLGQAKAAEEKWGVNVIAAANGDLFDYGDKCPLGPMYQNGVEIAEKYVDTHGQPAWTKHCFGIKKDGSFYIGKQMKSNLWTQLVGGEGIIISGGKIEVPINDDFFVTNHPRTAIGYDREGTLYLVEIDGRQPEISNGASFMDMALIFRYLGATDALNLDGGGSSVLYLENQQTGDLELMTYPSDDGEVRPCANSILLIEKKAN